MSEIHTFPEVMTPSLPVRLRAESSIGLVLLQMGKITPEDAERILRIQKEKGVRFGEVAQALGLISDTDIQQALASQFDYPYLQKGQGEFSSELLAAYQPFTPQVESLRAIRSQLMLRWLTGGRKSLSLVSVNSGEGTSFIAANLAVVFSQLGEHTLLVDANLRTPRQHEIFKLKSKQGLSDILAGRADLGAIAKIDSFVDLSVLPAGTLPPNPQELVSRSAFAEMSARLANKFDVVLYDVPGYFAGGDALAIAACTGGVLLVVRKNHTRLADIAKASEQLRAGGAEIVGSLLVDF
ncbi:MAG TPA: chain length determinant protein tyrosine kinase EpsG [Burkholderiaceae bacterium]|jgi:protein-tyrosine kinase|nr:chain length determinant protein tyrosine kinase EpsG [Burkholderiaceae bacterium]